MSGAATRESVVAAARYEVRWRWLIAIGSALAAAALVLPFTAKPLSWDEWVYMGLAFHPEAKGWVLNRYAHVYAMKPFMWLAGDPYVGARVYWSALFGVTVAALTWAALSLKADRARVLALTIFLLLGQETLFAFPGIAYADYTIMAVVTIAGALVLARIGRAVDLSAGDAAALGLLFVFGIKAKDAALPVLLLAGVLFIAPPGHRRADRTATRLAYSWLVGTAVAMVAIMALDGVILRDPLFSLRPSSWRQLVGFNISTVGDTTPQDNWLSLMLRPESFVSFAIYLGAGIPWATQERDRRLLIVYALPALFLLVLAVGGMFVGAPAIRRYTLPILPILCLLAALAFQSLIRDRSDAHRGSLMPWIGLAVVALLAVAFTPRSEMALLSGDTMRLWVGPVLTLTAAAAFLFLDRRARLAAAIATVAIVASGVLPLARVVDRLVRREAQLRGDARFAGFYEVARAVKVDRDALVFVSRNVYGGAIREGVTAAVTRLNFNVPLHRRPLVKDTWPPPADADYAVVSFDEYQQWLTRAGAEPSRAVVSHDREVALICLRAACRRPQ